jgi:hypothetical protein
MSILRKLEDKIQGLFEGGFGRAFKAKVQPVELARKLVKEMEDNKVVSVSRVYAPNEYTLFLSPEDAEQFEAYKEYLAGDLADYITESARRENYLLLSRPVVLFEVDEDLQMGEFGIATRMVSSPAQEEEIPVAPDIGRTAVYRPQAAPDGTVAFAADEARRFEQAHERITLSAGNEKYEITGPTVLIGRSKHADIVLPDPNISRSHAEVRRQGNDYIVVDLDSTNGIEVNGRRVSTQTLQNGDVITLGKTRVRFERQLC